MEEKEQKETLDKMIEFLSNIENKEKTLDEILDDLVEKKVNNAQVLTEKLIQQEINQNILLLKSLQKYMSNH